MVVTFSLDGSTRRTQDFLAKIQSQAFYADLDSLAQRGVAALQAATPVSSGLTAASWTYEIEISHGAVSIWWTNSNSNAGVNVAILLQYGHGTGTGGYVAGRDYINFAIQPIMDEIADDLWKKVTSA